MHRGVVVGAEAGGDIFQLQTGQPAKVGPGQAAGAAGAFREGADADISSTGDEGL